MAVSTGGSEIDGDIHRSEGVATPALARHLSQDMVGGGEVGVGGGTEHVFGRVVVGTEDGFPVGQVSPAGRVEQFVVRFHEHAGVNQAATTDAAAVQYHHVVEQRELLDTETAQGGGPEIGADVPVGWGEIGVPVAFAAFQHQYVVAFFGQAHGGNAAAEAGADDGEIVDLHDVYDPPKKRISFFSVETETSGCREGLRGGGWVRPASMNFTSRVLIQPMMWPTLAMTQCS